MMMRPSDFTDTDLVRLKQILKPLSVTSSTMRPDEVQAFFMALASGPDPLNHSFWWSEVLGDAVNLISVTLKEELQRLLEKLYAATVQTLARGAVPELILYHEDETEHEDYWSWCNAYLYALDSVPTDWFEQTDDEDLEALLLPVMALSGMFEEDEGEDLMDFSPAELADFKKQLPVALLAVYTYWHAK